MGIVDDDSEPGCGEDGRDQSSALVIDTQEVNGAAAATAEEANGDLASVSRLISINNPMKVGAVAE